MTRSRREAQDKNVGQGRNVACEHAGMGEAVTGKDANTAADSSGHILIGEPAAPIYHLTAKFELWDTRLSQFRPADQETTFLETEGPGTYTFPFQVRQYVASTDHVAEGSSITITFTTLPNS